LSFVFGINLNDTLEKKVATITLKEINMTKGIEERKKKRRRKGSQLHM